MAQNPSQPSGFQSTMAPSQANVNYHGVCPYCSGQGADGECIGSVEYKRRHNYQINGDEMPHHRRQQLPHLGMQQSDQDRHHVPEIQVVQSEDLNEFQYRITGVMPAPFPGAAPLPVRVPVPLKAQNQQYHPSQLRHVPHGQPVIFEPQRLVFEQHTVMYQPLIMYMPVDAFVNGAPGVPQAPMQPNTFMPPSTSTQNVTFSPVVPTPPFEASTPVSSHQSGQKQEQGGAGGKRRRGANSKVKNENRLEDDDGDYRPNLRQRKN